MPGVPVFNLVNIETIKVKIPIPEKEVSKIEKGQKALVLVTALGEDIQYETEVKSSVESASENVRLNTNYYNAGTVNNKLGKNLFYDYQTIP